MLGELSPWHLLILAAVVLVLFGAKKLPDSARSLGRAMRIFKAETAGLRGDGDSSGDEQPKAAAPPQQLSAAAPAAPAAAPAAAPVQASAQAPRDNGEAVNGVPVPETQRSNQPG